MQLSEDDIERAIRVHSRYPARRNGTINRLLGKAEWTCAERAYLRSTLVAMYFDSLFARYYDSEAGRLVTVRKKGMMASFRYDPLKVLARAFSDLDRFGRRSYRKILDAFSRGSQMDPMDAGHDTLRFILCNAKGKYLARIRGGSDG
jgi:hypothetical protein